MTQYAYNICRYLVIIVIYSYFLYSLLKIFAIYFRLLNYAMSVRYVCTHEFLSTAVLTVFLNCRSNEFMKGDCIMFLIHPRFFLGS